MEVQEIIKFAVNFLQQNYKDQLIKKPDAIQIDFLELVKANPDVGHNLLDDPEETMKCFEIALDNISEKQGILPRFNNLQSHCNKVISNLRVEDLGNLVSLKGIIRGFTKVQGQVISSKFECPSCGNIINILQLEKVHKEPTRCGCGRKGKFRELDNEIVNAFTLLLEESSEDLHEMQNPSEIKIILKKDLTCKHIFSKLAYGISVNITGVMVQEFKEEKNSKLNEITWYIDANTITFLDATYSNIQIQKKDILEIQEFSKQDNPLERISNIIFAGLEGLDHEKKILTLQAVGGVKFEGRSHTERGNIHILLIGDPSTGKTKMTKALKKYVPKLRYVAGGSGVSGAGLAGGVENDTILGRHIIIAGELPLAHKGVAIIDEIDKIDKDAVARLNEAMEEQEITISKIVKGRFLCETSIILGANFKNTRFDPYQSLISQITIDKSLLSRIDMIIVLRDTVDEKRDAAVVDAMFTEKKEQEQEVPPDFIRKYIAYARNIKPVVTQEAKDFLKQAFVETRQKWSKVMSNEQEVPNIAITFRDAYAMLRLAMACAKIKLKNRVEVEEAKEAFALKMYSLTQTAYDSEFGVVDVDRIYAGTTHSDYSVRRAILDYLNLNVVVGQPGIEIDTLMEDIKKQFTKMDSQKIDDIIKKMGKEGDVFFPRRNLIQRI